MSLCADENFVQLSVDSEDAPWINEDLFNELMKQFYDLGWMRGSGGAMGCIYKEKLIISPSSLQKERLTREDLCIYNITEKFEIQRPADSRIGVSSCAVLFTLIMNKTGARCVIHTHSKYANLVTQLVTSNVFEVTNQEYIKGVVNGKTSRYMQNTDTLRIPIIENQPKENLLLPALKETLEKHPECVAVLVRNHGLFVWGSNWEQCKIMTECIDYLLELNVEMARLRV